TAAIPARRSCSKIWRKPPVTCRRTPRPGTGCCATSASTVVPTRHCDGRHSYIKLPHIVNDVPRPDLALPRFLQSGSTLQSSFLMNAGQLQTYGAVNSPSVGVRRHGAANAKKPRRGVRSRTFARTANDRQRRGYTVSPRRAAVHLRTSATHEPNDRSGS